MKSSAQAARWNGMDFARAVLMILGLFFHAGSFYGTGNDWLIISDETTPIVNGFNFLIHSFRMEAFYLIAGFFFALVMEKQRPNFLRDRLVRIAVPLVVCGALINPVMHYSVYGYDYIIAKDYFIKGEWLSHLWFLGNLIIYILISIPICRHIRKNVRMTRTQLFVTVTFITPFVAAGLNFIANRIFPEKFLFIAPESIFDYLPYYCLGMICFYNRAEFTKLLSMQSFAIALVIAAAMIATREVLTIYGLTFISKVIYALLRGPMILLTLSFLIVMGNRESKIVRSFSDSSYTIYLFHLPIFVLLYKTIFQHTHLGALPEYALLIVITYALCYAIHIFAIKQSKLLSLAFNGKPFSLKDYSLLGRKLRSDG
ncbi:acyltransferase family protein [Cohaesibacter marisflavi]|nr:acyltransferase family protein [Cohaesibacter marisflavi]